MINTTDKEIFEKYGIVSYERDQLNDQLRNLQTQYNALELRYQDAIKRLMEKENGATGLDT